MIHPETLIDEETKIKLIQLGLLQMETDARLIGYVSVNQILLWLRVNSGTDQ